MPPWPLGRAEIEAMIRTGLLERVHASRDAADELLAQARQHLRSAAAIAGDDADGAHSLMYDAARKSLAAILENEGLRATTKGGHVATIDAVRAQLGSAGAKLLRQTNRMRVARNRSEYRPLEGPRIEQQDIDDALPAVAELIEKAEQVVDTMPAF